MNLFETAPDRNPTTTGHHHLDDCLGPGQPTFFFSRHCDERMLAAHIITCLSQLSEACVRTVGARHARRIDAAARRRVDLPLYHGGTTWHTMHDVADCVAPTWFLNRRPLIVIDGAGDLEPNVTDDERDATPAAPGCLADLHAVCRELKHAALSLGAAIIVSVATEGAGCDQRRSAEAACCLSMLADNVFIVRNYPDTVGNAVEEPARDRGICQTYEFIVDRCRGEARRPFFVNPSRLLQERGLIVGPAEGGPRDTSADSELARRHAIRGSAFALRESA